MRYKCLKKLNLSNVFLGVKNFVNSNYFPLFVMLSALLFHLLAWDVWGFLFLGAFAIFINLFCDDIRPLLPIAFCIPYVVSTQNTPGYAHDGWNGYYTSNGVVITLVILSALVLISFILRIFIQKGFKENLKKSRLILGFVLLIPCYLLAGIFSKYYDFNSFLCAIIMVGFNSVFYVLVFPTLKSKKDNFIYLSRVCVLTAILIVLEIAYVYLLKYEIGKPLNYTWKPQIVIGSLASNPAGGLIVIFLPFFFYSALKERFGYIYYALATVCMVGVFFTLSRAALLLGIPTFILGSIILLIFGKYKKECGLIFIVNALLGLVGLYTIYRNGYLENLFMFFINNKLSDSGRFEMWGDHFEYFKNYPIFGAGFSAYMIEKGFEWIYIAMAHNTIVQIISSCGIVGMALYLFHRYQTVKLFIENYNIEKLFIAFSLLLLIVFGMFDPTFFFPQFAIVYTFLLCFAERQESGEKFISL